MRETRISSWWLCLLEEANKQYGIQKYLYVAFDWMTVTYEHLELVTEVKTEN